MRLAEVTTTMSFRLELALLCRLSLLLGVCQAGGSSRAGVEVRGTTVGPGFHRQEGQSKPGSQML